MKATMNEYSIVNKTRIDSPSQKNPTDDDLQFSFFSGDGEMINVGIGIDIDPTHNFNLAESATPLKLPNTVTEEVQHEASSTDKVDEPEITASFNSIVPELGEVEPRLHIFAVEDTDSKPDFSHIENVTEKSAKLFAETRTAIDNRKINVDMENVKASLYVETLDFEEVSIAPLSGDFEKLEASYKDHSTLVKEKIIEGDRVTAADRTGKAVNWTVQTFIVSPVKGLFKAIYYHGIKELFNYLGNVLKFLLVSGVTTAVLYVVMANYSDSGLSAYEMAIQQYEALKGTAVVFYDDILQKIRGKTGM
ncbi:hypothetical protein SAMN03159341_13230 [Paenibacillus sp. 1_12]|uniref:hypothetical protein n=1 Tax=Paenibacillus sp. 1_12 TaxID=1566278 RepID=UPI0008EFBC29|nr:hypothetical protein [Paenibacillus sp. 1_12]SFM42311.1 hypothetical protein SAMN03159341_13230 [Paenibacillus sp. 1_12]